MGVALAIERSGGLYECAEVTRDGVVRVGSIPAGSGHETLFAQIAAAKLGLDVGQITVLTGDTDELADGVGSFSSRSTAMGGSAVAAAADDLLAGGPGVARFASDQVFASGAYVAVVEVDPATGAVRVRRLVAVDDAGTILNPLLAEGQVIGGAVRARRGLTERSHDPPRLAARLHLLTAAEIPEFATAFVESPSPLNPLGAKGVGESGTIGAPAAVANALADALGRHRRPAVHRREGLAGAAMTWHELLAHPRRRDADGVLTVLEEIDDDTGAAVYRRACESHTVRRTGQALDVHVLHGEVVDEEAAPAPSSLGRARRRQCRRGGRSASPATRRRG